MSATYVATESFTAMVDGIPVTVLAGRTLVDEQHALYKRFPAQFKLASERALTPDIEAATADPAEKRGARV